MKPHFEISPYIHNIYFFTFHFIIVIILKLKIIKSFFVTCIELKLEKFVKTLTVLWKALTYFGKTLTILWKKTWIWSIKPVAFPAHKVCADHLQSLCFSHNFLILNFIYTVKIFKYTHPLLFINDCTRWCKLLFVGKMHFDSYSHNLSEREIHN